MYLTDTRGGRKGDWDRPRVWKKLQRKVKTQRVTLLEIRYILRVGE